MPAEQTGLVKENYLWKVLLRRGSSKDGVFIHAPNGLFDHDLFSLIWGPTVAALSFVFDKSNDTTIYQKAISGFRYVVILKAEFFMFWSRQPRFDSFPRKTFCESLHMSVVHFLAVLLDF